MILITDIKNRFTKKKLTLNFEHGLNELYGQIRTSNFEFRSSNFELPKLLSKPCISFPKQILKLATQSSKKDSTTNGISTQQMGSSSSNITQPMCHCGPIPQLYFYDLGLWNEGGKNIFRVKINVSISVKEHPWLP